MNEYNTASLYPEILFHFTTKQGLKDILEHTFKIQYCKECIDFDDDQIEFCVPMVSFCDLKLSELKDHMEKYGVYGIGLTKKWAIERGLNPVFYVNSKATFLASLKTALSQIFEHIKENESENLLPFYNNVINIYRYLKNYQGILERQGTRKKYRFADEREWRYVPAMGTLPLKDIIPIEIKQKCNLLIKEKLSFQPEDIQYLIIKDDSEIDEFLEHLVYSKPNYSSDIHKKLFTRILTSEQVMHDI